MENTTTTKEKNKKRKQYPRLEQGIILPPDDTEISLIQENPKRGKSAVRRSSSLVARRVLSRNDRGKSIIQSHLSFIYISLKQFTGSI